MAIRNIIFRGKRIDNGEWVEGSGFLREGDTCWIYGKIKREGDWFNDWVKVDPTTVGQYTGLTDKNGKKICEGDRIEIRGYVYYCCWDAGNLEFILINEKESLGMGYAASSRMTVIGNIHDNPELLEVDNGKSNL